MEAYQRVRRVIKTCIKENLHNVWDVTLTTIFNACYRCRVAFTVVMGAEGAFNAKHNYNKNDIAVSFCLKEHRDVRTGIVGQSGGALQEQL